MKPNDFVSLEKKFGTSVNTELLGQILIQYGAKARHEIPVLGSARTLLTFDVPSEYSQEFCAAAQIAIDGGQMTFDFPAMNNE